MSQQARSYCDATHWAQTCLALAGRMLAALALVLMASLHAVNAPMETTYGLQPPPPRALDCFGLPLRDAPPASAPHPVGMAYLDELPEPPVRHPEPRAVDVLRNSPVYLAALFAGLAVLFSLAAGLGWLLLRITAGLRGTSYRVGRPGVDASVP